ncbi:MAG: YebC/PmpR family DNA-binding transcriptional regulator [Patescibacteria group bacterium]
MSGHSKWSTIKRQKGVNDAKRGQAFTKMGMAIAIAVREGGGGDPTSNFKLRLMMDQARAINMPKENVQRAIDRGLGKGGAAAIETVVYEGYGPNKVALIVVAATDNKNRTTPEIRSTIEKSGGTFATPGAVDWAFAEMGMITVEKNGKSLDELFELAADAGAEDIEDAGDVVEVYTKPADVEKVKHALAEKGLTVVSFEIFKKPTTLVEIKDAETAKKVLALIEKIEDLDDVQKVYSNFDIADNLLTL